MQITFVARKSRNVERNLHCDVLHITTIRVARLLLDCNGVFAIMTIPGRLDAFPVRLLGLPGQSHRAAEYLGRGRSDTLPIERRMGPRHLPGQVRGSAKKQIRDYNGSGWVGRGLTRIFFFWKIFPK